MDTCLGVGGSWIGGVIDFIDLIVVVGQQWYLFFFQLNLPRDGILLSHHAFS